MAIETIKKIIADILYLDEGEVINESDALFTKLNLSSIDYIDLCFELKQKCQSSVTPDILWPINKMMLDDQYYCDDAWTEKGRATLEDIFQVDLAPYAEHPERLNELFTVNYIDRRLKALV